MMETVYFAGGCLWGVQAFMKTIPGVVMTEAGRANGSSHTLDGDYDGYAECVKTVFDSQIISLHQLLDEFFEIIDPYSVNRQGNDIGEKYRTGVYSENKEHLELTAAYIAERPDHESIKVEVLPLKHYIRSAEEHQDRLDKYPEDYCHIPAHIMNKYRK